MIYSSDILKLDHKNINYEYQLSKAKIEELSAELLKSETNHNGGEFSWIVAGV